MTVSESVTALTIEGYDARPSPGPDALAHGHWSLGGHPTATVRDLQRY